MSDMSRRDRHPRAPIAIALGPTRAQAPTANSLDRPWHYQLVHGSALTRPTPHRSRWHSHPALHMPATSLVRPSPPLAPLKRDTVQAH